MFAFVCLFLLNNSEGCAGAVKRILGKVEGEKFLKQVFFSSS